MNRDITRWVGKLLAGGGSSRQANSIRNRSGRSLRCEVLESRQLLSVAPTAPATQLESPGPITTAFYYAAATSADEVVTFVDANLEAAVREALNMPTGDLTRGALETLTTLSAANRGIADLHGLEACTNLATVNLEANRVQDISPLAGLGALEQIWLDRNNVNTIPSFANARSLVWLWLGDNQVADVSGLAGATSLKYLNLGNNAITHVDALAGLANLESLHHDWNDIADVRALAALAALESLSLSDNRIEDASPLWNLDRLRILNLDGNRLETIAGVEALDNLETIDLGDNRVSDILPLSKLELVDLDLSANPVADFSPLWGMSSLESLTLSRTGFSDLGKVTPLTRLRFLNLVDNGVSDLTPLGNMTQLVGLGLAENQITDLTPLAGLVQLDYLSLSKNPISDFAPLTGLTKLRNLMLRQTGLEDLSFLSGLSSLVLLALGENQIHDVTPLAGLKDLRSVTLPANQITDISPLVEAANLGEGDRLTLGDNPLSDLCLDEQIPSLQARGVVVEYEGFVTFPDPRLEAAIREALSIPTGNLTSEDLRLLTYLRAEGQEIRSLQGIEACVNLTSIHLSDNRIGDLSPLAALANLQTLDLGGNRVSDLSTLALLTNLEEVDLSGNRITDISPLVQASNLGEGDRLWLLDNPLSRACLDEQIPALIARGVVVEFNAIGADAGGPYESLVGSSIWLQAFVSDALSGRAFSCQWDLDGDGQYDDAFGTHVRYSADTPATVMVGLRVTDWRGNSDTDVAAVRTLANESGLEIQGAEGVMDGGAEIVLRSTPSLSDLGPGSTLTWSATLNGAQVASGSGAEFVLPPAGLGDYLVSLTLTTDGRVVGEATEAIRLVHDFGPIDSTLTWTSTETSQGSFFHRLQTTRDARLTLEGRARKANHEIELQLYDADFRPLDQSVTVGGSCRVEWDALPEETYYFSLRAPVASELWALNAIAEKDWHTTVFGSAGHDTFQFNDRLGSVSLNGFTYALKMNRFRELAYHGNGGDDEIVLYSSRDGDSTFTIEPGKLDASNSAGTWAVGADGFSTLLAYSTGWQDKAILKDSPGSDKFKAEPNVTKMLRHGDYYCRLKSFPEVRAVSESGGNDVALFYGSYTDDQLTAQRGEIRLEGYQNDSKGNHFNYSAAGFRNAQIRGMGGRDVATMIDSALDDEIRARQHKVAMWAGDEAAPDYQIVARNFSSVSLQAPNGGYDRAKLHDTAYEDSLELGANSARLHLHPEKLDAMYEALAFEWVKCYSTTGKDTVTGAYDPLQMQLVLDGPWNIP